MSDPQTKDSDLTPEARAIIGRARRSFLFSIGLLFVGLIAVAGVLVYKSTQSSPAVPSGAQYSLAAVKVPSGAEIISATAADGRLTVTYRSGQATSIRIFDGRTGEIVREIPVVSEP
ncbi:MAG: DUF6476 family protein [Devosia sp.]